MIDAGDEEKAQAVLRPAAGDGVTINLSLVSHTNAGKTTLVRTLIGQDVGEVRDAAHVTEMATGYIMLQSGGDTLMLWDTPGFGDTARLLKRLKLAGNPIGWMLTQIWDRFRERPLWSSQQAVRNVRDHGDVILYMVNASEDPEDAGYVAPEMAILAWVGKPVVLLLNQMGPPSADAGAEEERWRRHLSDSPVMRGALTLDAFARCWVQEGTLLETIAPLLDARKQPALARLLRTWQEKNVARFRASMHILAVQLAAAAADSEALSVQSWQDKAGALLLSLRKRESPEAGRAMARLTERLANGTRTSTEQLIHAHGLSGKAAREVLRRLESDYASTTPAKEGFAAMLGGLMSGALGGLAADLAVGGMTLGGGMIVGGILGAVGAGGLARGYNMVRGEDAPAVRWSEDFFESLVRAALLRYLAVAHFGRGRGDYAEGEHPAYWLEAVDAVVAGRRGEVRALWQRGKDGAAADLVPEIDGLLTGCAAQLLSRFYPGSRKMLMSELTEWSG